MADSYTVAVFSPFDFKEGQKIQISSGPRRGDWEVVSFTEKKVRLRCPFSLKEFEWDRFCFHVEDQKVSQWPKPD